MSALLAAICDDVRRDRRGLALAATGVAIGVAALTFILAAGRGAERAVVDELLSRTPVNVVRVEPRVGIAIGPLRWDAGGLLTPAVDETAVAELRRVDGVAAVYPLASAGFPMRAQGGSSVLGHDVYMDMFAYGVDAAFLADDVDATGFADPGDGSDAPIPAVVSSQLLGIYNRTVAPAVGAPRFSAEAVVGFAFDLFLGESYTTGRNPRRQKATVRIVGVSPRVPLAGITIPIAILERWNRTFAPDKKPAFSAAYVETRSPRDIDAVVRRADALGLVVDESARLVGGIIRGTTAALSLIAALILAVAGLHTAQTFEARARSRRREIALLRALGATRRDVLGLFAGEALLVGAGGALAGVAVGLAGAWAAAGALRQALESLPFAPTRLVAIDALVVGLPIAAALLASLLGGLGPARRASRLDPAAVLAGGHG
ncbi:MAG: ABC transporter permease [Deltaproteobacteria bacterium]|nr:ABC transporter permease [Deltaproteobacteria bacterium]